MPKAKKSRAPDEEDTEDKEPNLPRSAWSAYMFFKAEQFGILKEARDTLSFGDTSKVVSHVWGQLSDNEREPYIAQAEEAKALLAEQKKAYARSLGKDPNRPKRGRSAYILFNAEQRPIIKKENPDLSFSDVSKLVGKRFKELSEAERHRYDLEAAADKERADQKRAVYDAMMAAEDAAADN